MYTSSVTFDSNINQAVGQALRALREEKGFTRSSVAAQVGTTPTSIYRYESGSQTPDLGTLYGLASVYETEVNAFLPTAEQLDNAKEKLHKKGHKP